MKNKHKSAETVDESLAIDIWNAGVSGAGAEKIVRDSICLGDSLSIAGETFDLPRLKKIIVVGLESAAAAWRLDSNPPYKTYKELNCRGW